MRLNILPHEHIRKKVDPVIGDLFDDGISVRRSDADIAGGLDCRCRIDVAHEGVGGVLLAQLSEQEIATAIARREPSPARHLEPDEAELRQSLARIRRDGYDITHAHRTLNTVGIAVPFFDGEGEVVGSVAFLIPEFRWATASQDVVVRALMGAAARMSGQLGYARPG